MLGPLAGVHQRESASPRVPFFGLSSVRRFVSPSRFRVRGHYECVPGSRPASRPTTRLDEANEKIEQEGHEDHEGGRIGSGEDCRALSRVRAITTGTADSVSAQDRDVLLFLFAFFALGGFACRFFGQQQSHEVDHTRAAHAEAAEPRRGTDLRAGSVGVATCCLSAMNCGVAMSLCRRQSEARGVSRRPPTRRQAEHQRRLGSRIVEEKSYADLHSSRSSIEGDGAVDAGSDSLGPLPGVLGARRWIGGRMRHSAFPRPRRSPRKVPVARLGRGSP